MITNPMPMKRTSEPKKRANVLSIFGKFHRVIRYHLNFVYNDVEIFHGILLTILFARFIYDGKEKGWLPIAGAALKNLRWPKRSLG